MSDLVGNPEDRFSRVAAHMDKIGDVFYKTIMICFEMVLIRLYREIPIGMMI